MLQVAIHNSYPAFSESVSLSQTAYLWLILPGQIWKGWFSPSSSECEEWWLKNNFRLLWSRCKAWRWHWSQAVHYGTYKGLFFSGTHGKRRSSAGKGKCGFWIEPGRAPAQSELPVWTCPAADFLAAMNSVHAKNMEELRTFWRGVFQELDSRGFRPVNGVVQLPNLPPSPGMAGDPSFVPASSETSEISDSETKEVLMSMSKRNDVKQKNNNNDKNHLKRKNWTLMTKSVQPCQWQYFFRSEFPTFRTFWNVGSYFQCCELYSFRP